LKRGEFDARPIVRNADRHARNLNGLLPAAAAGLFACGVAATCDSLLIELCISV